MTDAWTAIRSFSISLRASSRLGRCQRLRRQNRGLLALEAAHDGLALLRAPGVRRDQPAEGSILVGLTTNAEQLAQELHQPGPTNEDLRDSYEYLVGLEPEGKKSVQEFRAEWLPYLRKRLRLDADKTDA
jgi:hypothetical protein